MSFNQSTISLFHAKHVNQLSLHFSVYKYVHTEILVVQLDWSVNQEGMLKDRFGWFDDQNKN